MAGSVGASLFMPNVQHLRAAVGVFSREQMTHRVNVSSTRISVHCRYFIYQVYGLHAPHHESC